MRDKEGVLPLGALLRSSQLLQGGQLSVPAEEGRREGALKGDKLHGPFALAKRLPYLW